jgi:hypothetical protein
MIRILAATLAVVVLSGGCVSSPGEARSARSHEEVHGEIVGFAYTFDSEVALRVHVGQETITLLAERDTAVSADGVPISVGALREYAGFWVTASCRRERGWCVDTRQIDLASPPVRLPVGPPESRGEISG